MARWVFATVAVSASLKTDLLVPLIHFYRVTIVVDFAVMVVVTMAIPIPIDVVAPSVVLRKGQLVVLVVEEVTLMDFGQFVLASVGTPDVVVVASFFPKKDPSVS